MFYLTIICSLDIINYDDYVNFASSKNAYLKCCTGSKSVIYYEILKPHIVWFPSCPLSVILVLIMTYNHALTGNTTSLDIQPLIIHHTLLHLADHVYWNTEKSAGWAGTCSKAHETRSRTCHHNWEYLATKNLGPNSSHYASYWSCCRGEGSNITILFTPSDLIYSIHTWQTHTF